MFHLFDKGAIQSHQIRAAILDWIKELINDRRNNHSHVKT